MSPRMDDLNASVADMALQMKRTYGTIFINLIAEKHNILESTVVRILKDCGITNKTAKSDVEYITAQFEEE